MSQKVFKSSLFEPFFIETSQELHAKNCITEGRPVFRNNKSVLIQPHAAACLQMLLLAGFECLVSVKVTKDWKLH